MDAMRKLIWQELKTALLAVGVVYLLLSQGLISAYAQTAMAVSEAGPRFILCSPLGGASDEDPIKALARDCCSTLCQAASTLGPLLPSSPVVFGFKVEVRPAKWRPAGTVRGPPSETRLVPEARGPPPLSI
ncbi:hypothetical protein OSH10_20760 [Kaistia defluvii]|uniref:hypothetical protein n=1 Tax=Kaistia defluvii TaxID=410841 RepID=UPI00225AD332|nr:hypothetical protein [Kaistia defluvii]MCX5520876.1 hypothetical protein [Kaistia defluvii]